MYTYTHEWRIRVETIRMGEGVICFYDCKYLEDRTNFGLRRIIGTWVSCSLTLCIYMSPPPRIASFRFSTIRTCLTWAMKQYILIYSLWRIPSLICTKIWVLLCSFCEILDDYLPVNWKTFARLFNSTISHLFNYQIQPVSHFYSQLCTYVGSYLRRLPRVCEIMGAKRKTRRLLVLQCVPW